MADINTTTLDEGPSSDNETSSDRDQDTNQGGSQPSTEETLRDSGLDQTDGSENDLEDEETESEAEDSSEAES